MECSLDNAGAEAATTKVGHIAKISNSSTVAGRTGRRSVKARVTLAFQLNFKVIIRKSTQWTSAY